MSGKRSVTTMETVAGSQDRTAVGVADYSWWSEPGMHFG